MGAEATHGDGFHAANSAVVTDGGSCKTAYGIGHILQSKGTNGLARDYLYGDSGCQSPWRRCSGDGNLIDATF